MADSITIAHARFDDLPGIVATYNQVLATSNANFDSEPASVESRTTWFGQFGSSGPFRLLVARRAGVVLGYACSGRYRDHPAFRRTVEFSISLDEDCRGQGVGSKLYAALIAELAEEPVHVAVAGIALPNDASVALHKKFGFTEVGVFREYAIKHGQYISSMWLERILSDVG
jgi:phosphinothricin acetyltransferase